MIWALKPSILKFAQNVYAQSALKIGKILQ